MDIRKNLAKFILIFLLFSLFFIFNASFIFNFKDAIPLVGDEPSYMAMGDSLAFFKTFNLREEIETKHYQNFFISTDSDDIGIHNLKLGQKQYPFHSLGWPILLAPLFFLSNNPRILAMFLQNLISAFLIFNIFLWLKERKYKTNSALIVSLTVAFTLPLTMQNYLLFSEPIAALCLIYIIRKYDRPNLLSVLATAALPWIHFKYLILIPFLVWPLLKSKEKKWPPKFKDFWPIIFVFLSILGLFIFNKYAYNSFLAGQLSGAKYGLAYAGALLGIFVNKLNGLFTVSPVYLAAFFGLGITFVRQKSLFYKIIIPFGLLWLVSGTFDGWHGGQAPAGRLLLTVLPLLAVPLAEVWEYPAFNWLSRSFYIILAIPGLLLGFWGRVHPVELINRLQFSNLNILQRFLNPAFNYQKPFPVNLSFSDRLNIIWIIILVLLFILGVILEQKKKILLKYHESVNRYFGPFLSNQSDK